MVQWWNAKEQVADEAIPAAFTSEEFAIAQKEFSRLWTPFSAAVRKHFTNAAGT